MISEELTSNQNKFSNIFSESDQLKKILALLTTVTRFEHLRLVRGEKVSQVSQLS